MLFAEDIEGLTGVSNLGGEGWLCNHHLQGRWRLFVLLSLAGAKTKTLTP